MHGVLASGLFNCKHPEEENGQTHERGNQSRHALRTRAEVESDPLDYEQNTDSYRDS